MGKEKNENKKASTPSAGAKYREKTLKSRQRNGGRGYPKRHKTPNRAELAEAIMILVSLENTRNASEQRLHAALKSLRLAVWVAALVAALGVLA